MIKYYTFFDIRRKPIFNDAKPSIPPRCANSSPRMHRPSLPTYGQSISSMGSGWWYYQETCGICRRCGQLVQQACLLVLRITGSRQRWDGSLMEQTSWSCQISSPDSRRHPGYRASSKLSQRRADRGLLPLWYVGWALTRAPWAWECNRNSRRSCSGISWGAP